MSQNPAHLSIVVMNPQDYIPKPCHEKWDTMTGNQRQKFCDKCSCSVHNLTGMNHEQIMELRNDLGGKLCGAFNAKKKVRRIHLKRPLIIGASISSLALAACQQEKDISVIGECVSTNPPKTQTTPEPEPEIMGDICIPEEPDSPKEEPVKEPIILGKILIPK